MSNTESYNLSDEDRDLVRHYEEAVANCRYDYFDVDEMEIIIEHYLFDGDLNDAQKALEYGLKLHPNDNYLECQKAAIKLHRGELQEALQLLDRYRDADDPVHSFNRAEILYKLGRRQEALAIFHQLVEQHDEECDIPGLCADITRLINSLQDYSNSLYFIEQGLKVSPNDCELLEDKGYALDNLGEDAEAIELYNKVLDIDPYRISTWHLLGALYFEQERFADALEAYSFALAIDPNDMLATSQKAYCQYNVGDVSSAAATCRKYLLISPADDEMLTLLGECFAAKEQHSEAQKLFVQATGINPANNSAWFCAAVSTFKLGNIEQAKLFLKKAIELKPQTVEYFIALSEMFYEEQDFQGAVDALSHIVTNLDAEDAYAWKKLGDIYLEVGEYEKSTAIYEEAIHLCSEQGIQLEGLFIFAAIAYYGIGNFETAQSYYDMAKRTDSTARATFLRIYPKAEEHIIL